MVWDKNCVEFINLNRKIVLIHKIWDKRTEKLSNISLSSDFANKKAPKGGGVAGALEPIILKAWGPGAQTIPMAIFSNFKK